MPFSQRPLSPQDVWLHLAAILVINNKLHNITQKLNTSSQNFRLYFDLKINKNICKISVIFGLLNSYMSKIKPTWNFTISGHERIIQHYGVFFRYNTSEIPLKCFRFWVKLWKCLQFYRENCRHWKNSSQFLTLTKAIEVKASLLRTKPQNNSRYSVKKTQSVNWYLSIYLIEILRIANSVRERNRRKVTILSLRVLFGR